MKLNGIIGKGTGKLGSSVFAISGGEQVVREYNPVVSNPNTEAQIAQRAKLKLMSQLAAAMMPALAFTKKGLVSARNQFVSKNIGLSSFNNNAASVGLLDVQLTPSNSSFPLVDAAAGDNNTINVTLNSSAPESIKRVVYNLFKKTGEDKLEFVSQKVVSVPGESRHFGTTFTVDSGTYIVYAYGVSDKDAAATARYEDYVAESNQGDAILEVNRMVKVGDSYLTMSTAFQITIE